LRVTAVPAGSLAAKAGLRAGDLILKCGGDQVESGEALREALSGAGGVTRLQIQRGSEKSFIAY
ncbi:MAG: PDZ domain-containing protein, partial [Myxococcota bacterium]|nr:PDZ domain-containing protein [Myxococcota bacterium]